MRAAGCTAAQLHKVLLYEAVMIVTKVLLQGLETEWKLLIMVSALEVALPSHVKALCMHRDLMHLLITVAGALH